MESGRQYAVVVFFDTSEQAAEHLLSLGLDARSDARLVRANEVAILPERSPSEREERWYALHDGWVQ
jgi:hypothetical protein